MQQLPVPPHFDPQAVGSIWRVPCEERAQQGRSWAAEHHLAAAADDSLRVAPLLVDVQNTFCIPGFELFVAGRSGTGAVDDNRRLCEFIYRNLGTITEILPSLDTHHAMQLFHAIWLVDADGNHPSPYTLASVDDVASGRWRVNQALAASLGLDPDYAQRQLAHYTRRLAVGGKYELTVWPYHAMLGGIGHALVSAVEEAIFFHTIARVSQPDFQVKGDNPLTEHYSMLGPEVTDGPDGEPLAARHAAVIEKLLGFDLVVVAGQAKSHCVEAAAGRRGRGRDRLALPSRQLGQGPRQRIRRRTARAWLRARTARDLGGHRSRQPPIRCGVPQDRDAPARCHPPLVPRPEPDVLGRRAQTPTALARPRPTGLPDHCSRARVGRSETMTASVSMTSRLAPVLERPRKGPIAYFRMPYVDTAILHGNREAIYALACGPMDVRHPLVPSPLRTRQQRER